MGLPNDPADVEQSLDFIRNVDAHIMGRVAYEGIAAAQRAAGEACQRLVIGCQRADGGVSAPPLTMATATITTDRRQPWPSSSRPRG
jgi:hypothetical protein